MQPIVTLTMNPALDIATATDRVVPAHKLRCAAPRYDPGGGGINVARGVHALGGGAIAIFPAGGAAGEMIRHLLEQEGVAHHPIAIAGFTRESLAVDERETGRQYRFILPGPEISERDQERCLDELSLLAPKADFIVASGSLPIGVSDDFYTRVAELAKKLGKRLILDTSGSALKKAGGGIYLLKPSLRELEDLSGREIRSEGDQERAARQIVEEGTARSLSCRSAPRAHSWPPPTGASALPRSRSRQKAQSALGTACWQELFSVFAADCPCTKPFALAWRRGQRRSLERAPSCAGAPMSSGSTS